MNARAIFWSRDFGFAVAVFVGITTFGPTVLPNAVAKDLYSAGISVLSIVFSVFFAALATIASSSDDDFVRFLDEDDSYTKIISAFRFTLGLLFVALLYSLAAYGVTALLLDHQTGGSQPWYFTAVFGFLFSWGLVATYDSAHDAITYAAVRAVFLRRTKRRDD